MPDVIEITINSTAVTEAFERLQESCIKLRPAMRDIGGLLEKETEDNFDVPAWLRPYHVLSTGEQFRADLARIICEAPAHVVVDEFTSVVDRQIAKVEASAFAKAWRRTGGQAVL